MDDKNNESAGAPKKEEKKVEAQDSKNTDDDDEDDDDKKGVTFEAESDNIEINESDEKVVQRINYEDNEPIKDTRVDELIELRQSTTPDVPRRETIIGDGASATSIEIKKFLQQYGMGAVPPSSSMAGEAFIYMKIPPDGGYSWIVLLGSVLCLMIADGHAFTLGLILPTIGQDLSFNSSQQALVTSTLLAAYYLSGPFSSAFINKFGFISVGVSGAILGVIAYILGSWANSFLYLLLLFGFISGVGLGMLWVTSQLIIGYYFEIYRPVASGISCSGSGLGMLVFSTINPIIVKSFGWRNAFRVSAVFIAIAGLLCFLFVAVQPTIIGKVQLPEDDEEDVGSEQSIELVTAHYSKFAMPSSADLARGSLTRQQKSEEKKPKVAGDGDQNMYVINNDILDREDIFYTGKPDYSKTPVPVKSSIVFAADKKGKTIGYSMSMIRAAPEKPRKKRKWLPAKIGNALAVLFDFTLLKIFEFQLLMLSALLFNMGSNIPYIYSESRANVPDYLKSNLLAIIGFTNIIFRILTGYITYKFDVDKSYICGGGACLAGTATFISSFFGENFIWFQILYSVLFGIGIAIFASLRALVYVQILGLEKLTSAFGLTSAVLGVGVFVGTTIGGVLRDTTGNFIASFAFSGICMASSGMIKLFLPVIIRKRSKQN